MYRLARYDVTRLFKNAPTRFAAQILFGLACTAVLIVIMLLVQLWVPLPGPFVMAFAAVVIATLYGQWPAGLSALCSSVFAVWMVVLPDSIPLSFSSASDTERVAMAAIIGLIVLLIVETFRRAIEQASRSRDAELEHSAMLLREFEHRTRNNFALVASLLEFQRRQSDVPEVRRALDQAISRVHTFADAYAQLRSTADESDAIDMQTYLSRLLDRFGDALFGDTIQIESEIAEVALESKKAVAVGLYLNEALTNCAKYAFPEGHGTVKVALAPENGGWRLTVVDDGIGEPEPPAIPSKRTGLGAILFEALAQQAGATHQVTLTEQGRRLDLVSAA